MLEAQIVSPRGSLYVAVEATPYDLENLRRHVLALAPHAEDASVELQVDEPEPVIPALSAWLWQLAEVGVHVQCTPGCVTRRRPDVAA